MRLSDPGMGALELADCVAHLPPGCALWRSTGGGIAWSDETSMLVMIEHGVRILAWMQSEDGKQNRNYPKPVRPPRPAHEVSAQVQKEDARAAAWMARQQRSATG